MPAISELLPEKIMKELKTVGYKGDYYKDVLKDAGGDEKIAEMILDIRGGFKIPIVAPSPGRKISSSVRVMAQKGVNRRGF